MGLIHLGVSDTGIGISKEDQPILFTKFFRADESSTRKDSGMVLGLCQGVLKFAWTILNSFLLPINLLQLFHRIGLSNPSLPPKQLGQQELKG